MTEKPRKRKPSKKTVKLMLDFARPLKKAEPDEPQPAEREHQRFARPLPEIITEWEQRDAEKAARVAEAAADLERRDAIIKRSLTIEP